MPNTNDLVRLRDRFDVGRIAAIEEDEFGHRRYLVEFTERKTWHSAFEITQTIEPEENGFGKLLMPVVTIPGDLRGAADYDD